HNSKEIVKNIANHTVLSQIAGGGGGGYGDPFKRPIEVVLNEVKNGRVSVKRAKVDYGVVINPESLELDDTANKTVRSNRP
ncbi:MAG TPA: hypothetical protein QF359_00990, partial [Rhodospirillales bacterium]|nr:hypothetical protein [Rhodospirillales bacterium]